MSEKMVRLWGQVGTAFALVVSLLFIMLSVFGILLTEPKPDPMWYDAVKYTSYGGCAVGGVGLIMSIVCFVKMGENNPSNAVQPSYSSPPYNGSPMWNDTVETIVRDRGVPMELPLPPAPPQAQGSCAIM